MRSNIARTCGSSSVPVAGVASVLPPFAVMPALLELAEERDERLELLGLLLGKRLERRHRRRRVAQRLRDRRGGQHGADLAQVRAGTVVAVLTDLVAGKAARLSGHQLASVPLRQRGALEARRR